MSQIINGVMTTHALAKTGAKLTNLIDIFMGSLKKGQKYRIVYGVQLISIEAMSNKAFCLKKRIF